jgi:hypothetical protein
MVELLLQLAALGLVEIIALTVIITNIVLGDFRMTGFWVFMVVLVAFSIKCVLDDLKKLKL